MEPVLILSFWNPIPQLPFKGLFIHEQVKAICERNSNILFLEVNILPSNESIFSKSIIQQPYYTSHKITLNIYSFLWKVIYVNPWFVYRIIKATLKKEAPSFRPSLVHSNIIYPCGIIGYLLAKDFKVKHIISEHWSKAVNILKHPVYKRAALKVYRNSQAVLCVSEFLANTISKASGITKTQIVPNIIDTSIFEFVFKTKKTINDISFTCAAHWEHPKRLDLIIDSLTVFARQKQKLITLNVIGKGSQRNTYLNKPENYLHINWLGFIPKHQIPPILQKTDYFLHASETETFSIVIVEALSTGTPVLASNKGAIPALINLSNGILVDNTLEDWISGLNEIIGREFDNSAIAKNIGGKYTSLVVSQKIEKIYDEVLKNNP